MIAIGVLFTYGFGFIVYFRFPAVTCESYAFCFAYIGELGFGIVSDSWDALFFPD